MTAASPFSNFVAYLEVLSPFCFLRLHTGHHHQPFGYIATLLSYRHPWVSLPAFIVAVHSLCGCTFTCSGTRYSAALSSAAWIHSGCAGPALVDCMLGHAARPPRRLRSTARPTCAICTVDHVDSKRIMGVWPLASALSLDDAASPHVPARLHVSALRHVTCTQYCMSDYRHDGTVIDGISCTVTPSHPLLSHFVFTTSSLTASIHLARLQ